MTALGVLTIGQSPRDDIVPVLRHFLPAETAVTEIGCLDDFSDVEIADLTPVDAHDGIETRLRSGESVIVSKSALEPMLVSCLRDLPRPVLFLCSSVFSAMSGQSGIIQPSETILPVMRHAASGQILGVIGPESDLPRQPDYWHPHTPGAQFAAGSPTDPVDVLIDAAQALRANGCTMLFLDCMGFSNEQREVIRTASGLPTIAATTLVARLLPEFL